MEEDPEELSALPPKLLEKIAEATRREATNPNGVPGGVSVVAQAFGAGAGAGATAVSGTEGSARQRATAWCKAGIVQWRQGALPESLTSLTEAVKQDPTAAAAHHHAAIVQEELGDVAAASELYHRATELDPALAEAWFNLGELEQRQSEKDHGVKSLRLAVELEPLNHDYHVSLGAALQVRRIHSC